MAIDKINRVVLSKDIKDDLNSKATKTELLNTKSYLENQLNNVVSNLVRKPSVSTYDDIKKMYPYPKEGWTLSVDDTNITYQYDSQTDTWIKTSINALPKATPELDGLFTKEDKKKLDSIQSDAQANKTSKEILEEIKKIDGSDSGLDADMLDGKHAKDFANKEHEHDGRYYSKKDSDIKFATKDEMGKAGYGDMLRLTYDKNGNGKVDNAENLSIKNEKPSNDLPSTWDDGMYWSKVYNNGFPCPYGYCLTLKYNNAITQLCLEWKAPDATIGSAWIRNKRDCGVDKFSEWRQFSFTDHNHDDKYLNKNSIAKNSEQVNGHKYSVGNQAPSNPQQNDVWIDTSN